MGDKFKELLKQAQIEKYGEELPPEIDQEDEEEAEETATPKHLKESKGKGIARRVWLFVCIIFICIFVAYVTIAGFFDFVALGKSDVKVDVEVSENISSAALAKLLAENDLIDQPLIFRLYSVISGKDGNYKAGTYTLSANMGYSQLSSKIVIGNPRETATVTIPEGYTITQIAKLLEKNNVCSTSDFYDALIHETYDYDFFASIPQSSDGGKYEGRIYRLEGYLFPDTYEFYTESSGKSVINKMLGNFNTKMSTTLRSAMQAKGLTLDDVVIMASIAQRESANTTEMPRVTKVLYNRLNSDYTRLECDSTGEYTDDLQPDVAGVENIGAAYNTYQRSGLPAGAICNPGLAALEAAINPTTEAKYAEYYYFANDKYGNTYYSKTFSQHVAICKRYKIGIYG